MPLVRSYRKYEQQGCLGLVATKGGVGWLADGSICSAALSTVNGYHPRTGEQVVQLGETADKDEVTCVTVGPDGVVVATGNRQGRVKLWSAKDNVGTELVTLSGHRAAVTALKFIEGGAMLVSGSQDTDVIVWDVVAEAGVVRLHGHTGPVTDVAELTAENLLLTSSKDSLIKVWDLVTQHCIQTIVGHRTEVHSMVFNAAQTRLYTGAADAELRVWSVAAADDEEAITSESTQAAEGVPVTFTLLGSVQRASRDRAERLEISPGGGLLGCQGADKVFEMFALRTEEEVVKRLARRSKRAREKAKKGVAEGGSAAGGAGAEAGAGAGEVARKLDDECQAIGTIRFPAKLRGFAFAPAEAGAEVGPTIRECKLAVSLSNNVLETHKVSATKKSMESTPLLSIQRGGHRTPCRAVAISHDDALIISTSNSGAKIWDRATQKCVRTLKAGYGLCTAFVPGNRHAIVGTRSGEIQLFDLGSGDMIEEIEDAHESAIWSLDIQPDNHGFVTGGADRTVKFWEFELIADSANVGASKRLTAVHVKTLKMADDVMCVKFSPDQKYLAVALLDTTVKVFFADTLKFYLSLYGHKLPVLSIDISRDSTLLLTGSGDKNAKLWGLDFGDCHKSFFAHDDAVTAVKFVGATHHFFTTGKDKLVKQWDGDKFDHIMTLEGHQAEVSGICAASNGSFVVSCGHDRSIRVWERSQELINLEEEREIARELEQDEAAAEEEAAAARSRAKNVEAEMPGKRSADTLQNADRLLEAIELVEIEENKAAGDAKNPLLVAYGFEDPGDYLLMMLNRVTSAELEESLLVLPFAYVTKLIPFLDAWIEKGLQTERCIRCLHLLFKIHMNQIVSNQALVPIMDSLRRKVLPGISRVKDEIGFNLAGLRFLKQEIESRGVHTFEDVAERVERGGRRGKEKRRKVIKA